MHRARHGAPPRSALAAARGPADTPDRRARHRLPPARQIHPDAAGRRRFRAAASRHVRPDGADAGCGRNQPTPHEHLVLETDDGWRAGLRRSAPLRLGRSGADTRRRTRTGCWRSWGPNRWTTTFTAAALTAALAGKRTPIKAALLDQKVVAGLGNIYVCEALFRARISARSARPTPSRARAPPGWCRRSRRRCTRRSRPAVHRCATTCSRTANWAISSTPGRSMAARASPASAARAARPAPASAASPSRGAARSIARGPSGEIEGLSDRDAGGWFRTVGEERRSRKAFVQRHLNSSRQTWVAELRASAHSGHRASAQ